VDSLRATIFSQKLQVMKSIILIFCCAVSLSAAAQNKPAKTAPWQKMKDHKPMMTKSVGFSSQQFTNLKSRLAGFPQYAPLRDHMWTISLGSMHEMKNFISQMSITAGSSMTGNPEERSSTMRFLSGGFDIGYDFIPAARVMVYPMVGLGVENYHAILWKDVNAVDFDDVANSPSLQNSIRSVKFTNTFFTYRLGLGIGFKSPDGNHTIGVQGGYTGSFKDKAWQSAEDQALRGAPVDDLKRFSVSLVLTGNMMGMCK
jgi:opacity protein-like surface antigen